MTIRNLLDLYMTKHHNHNHKTRYFFEEYWSKLILDISYLDFFFHIWTGVIFRSRYFYNAYRIHITKIQIQLRVCVYITMQADYLSLYLFQFNIKLCITCFTNTKTDLSFMTKLFVLQVYELRTQQLQKQRLYYYCLYVSI